MDFANVPGGVKDVFDRAELDRFRSAVASQLGLQFDNGRVDWLADILRQRLDGRKMNCERYVASLLAGTNREELRTLASLLTVTETYFFRAPEHFRVLAEVVLPERIRVVKPPRPLRILSAGCSSGDEPFSIGMLIQEHYPELKDVYIVGIDVNPLMLAKAAEARYAAWSLRETPAEMRERYFSQQGREFVLDPRIRRMVRFEERNIGVENGRPWDLDSFDIVFCRNTIMYMVPEAVRLAVARLTRAVAAGGFLFLSHAETLRGLSHDFHLRHTHDSFYYQKREEGVSEAPPPNLAVPQCPPEAVDISWVDAIRLASEHIESLSRNNRRPQDGPRKSQTPGERQRSAAHLGIALDLLRQERFREALETVQDLPPECAADRDVVLLHAVLLINCGEVSAARQACEQLLSSDDLNASAQYLTALCHEHAGDAFGAMEHDRAAIYLDPAFAMPHLHLGLLAKRSGDLTTARREMERAAVLLEREDASRILLLGGGFSRRTLLEFSQAESRTCGERQ
jgi:chemotaxis protein methyltransferase CheR